MAEAPNKKQKVVSPVCPDLPDMDNLPKETIMQYLSNPNIIYLYTKSCSKSQNESMNKWREHLFVFLFNMKEGNPLLEEPDWRKAWENVRLLEKTMFEYESSVDPSGWGEQMKSGVVETSLVLQAGQGNYDFDFVVKFNVGPEQVRHYEYKNHTPEKLPQLLSLYDLRNPIVGDRLPEGHRYAGKYATKYTCLQASYRDEDAFQFWLDKPFWLYHLMEHLGNGKMLRIKIDEFAAANGMRPLPPILSDEQNGEWGITELDYFCAVKSTDGVPCRTSNKDVMSLLEKMGIDVYKIYTDGELEKLTKTPVFAAGYSTLGSGEKKVIDKFVKDKCSKMFKKWDKPGLFGNSEAVTYFFQLLYVCHDKTDWFDNMSKLSMQQYLELFMKDEPAKTNLCGRLFENIRVREAGKRFIFYYGNEKGEPDFTWKMSTPYAESFEIPPELPIDEIVTLGETKKGSELTKITIKTKSGNRLEFNLRWANSIGIQNPAWQMNIRKGYEGTAKLLPEIVELGGGSKGGRSRPIKKTRHKRKGKRQTCKPHKKRGKSKRIFKKKSRTKRNRKSRKIKI